MKTKFLFLLSMFIFHNCSPSPRFPVSEWNSNNENKPIIFLLSGDSGFNSFTKTLAANFHELGFDVFALDCKQYFWEKRSPKETAEEIQKFIADRLKNRTNKKVILMGYSFGSDVLPFLINLFPDDFRQNLKKVVLIGPSTTADFEIHLANYVIHQESALKVIPEINKIGNTPTLLVASDYEVLHFPYRQIKLSNFSFLYVPGNHHYNGNTKNLAEKIYPYLN